MTLKSCLTFSFPVLLNFFEILVFIYDYSVVGFRVRVNVTDNSYLKPELSLLLFISFVTELGLSFFFIKLGLDVWF